MSNAKTGKKVGKKESLDKTVYIEHESLSLGESKCTDQIGEFLLLFSCFSFVYFM